MKRNIIIFLVVIILFSLPVRAESQGNYTKEFIHEQAELAGVDRLGDSLPDESRQYMQERNISPEESGWADSIDLKEVFVDLWQLVTSKVTKPLAGAGTTLAVILLSGLLSAAQSPLSARTANIAVTAAAAAVILAPLLAVIQSTVGIMQELSVFMMAFVPAFAVVLASSGQAVTSASMSGMLLGAAQAVEIVSNHFVIPLMCGYLSISVVSGVSPLLSKSALADMIRKMSYWIMSLITTVFIGVLSIQTTINASADTLAMRTARFVIGSSVPVAGTVLSEALSTVTGSLGMLKASTAIYGVVACCVILLPLLTELLLWRIALNLTAFAANLFDTGYIPKLLYSADTAIAVLCGIILLTGALFIISLSVVVSVGKA